MYELTLEELGMRLVNNKPLSDDLTNSDIDALYSHAYTLYGVGSVSDSRVLFEQLTTLQPLSERMWMGLAASLQVEKNYDEAIRAWDMVTVLKSHDAMPYIHIAECYFCCGKPALGLKALKAAKKHATKAGIGKIIALEAQWNEEGGE